MRASENGWKSDINWPELTEVMRLLSHLALLMILTGCGRGAEDSSIERAEAANEYVSIGADQPAAWTPVETPSKAPIPRPEVPEDCPLVVDFASYGAGIDRETKETVEKLLASDPAVLSVDLYPWGREGEIAICATTRSREAAERLFHTITAMLPRDPRGPLGVRTKSGLSRSVSRYR